MIYFILALIWSIVILLVSSKIKNKVLLFLFTIPLVIFSSFRGIAGSDTINYIYMYRDINITIDERITLDGEPLVYLIMYIARNMLSGGLENFYVLYAVVYCMLLTNIISGFEKYRVFLLTVGCVFIVDGLTNTLRISLAYLFYLISVNQKGNIKYIILGFFSHISFLLMLLLKWVISKVNVAPKLSFLLNVCLMSVCFVILGLVFNELVSFFPRVANKFAQYKELQSLSTFSGLSDVFVIASLLLLASIYNRSTGKEMLFDVIFISIACVSLMVFAQTSIVAYRLFKIIILVLSVSSPLSMPKRRIPTKYLMLVGGIYTLNFIRILTSGEFIDNYGQGVEVLYGMQELY